MKNFVIAVLGKFGKKSNTAAEAASSEAAAEVIDVQFSALSMLIDVDTHRQRLAAGDTVLNQALGGIELTLAHELGRHVRQR